MVVKLERRREEQTVDTFFFFFVCAGTDRVQRQGLLLRQDALVQGDGDGAERGAGACDRGAVAHDEQVDEVER